MKVKELIEKLQAMSESEQDLEVWNWEPEGGYFPMTHGPEVVATSSWDNVKEKIVYSFGVHIT